jgi:hypothetical protein
VNHIRTIDPDAEINPNVTSFVAFNGKMALRDCHGITATMKPTRTFAGKRLRDDPWTLELQVESAGHV